MNLHMAVEKEHPSPKAEDIQIEENVDPEHAGLNSMNLPNYHDEETKQVLRKVDWRLIPVLALLYLLSFLDRGNLFFIPYTLCEIPSNMILKTMRPSIWLTILVLTWGTVITLQGMVKNASGLIATRFCLGICEAGFFPAASYLLGEWYCRFDIQWRLSLLYSSASLAGAFSGLLAYLFEKMAGIGGLSGWRWIFIMEGLITVAVGLSLPWAVPDSPESVSFLTATEKVFIRRRLEQDTGTSAGKVQTRERFQWRFLKAAFSDWRVWFTVFICWGNTVTANSFNFTAPTIILQLGYTAANAQLMTIPIYLAATVSTLVCSWFADKYQARWPFIVFPYCIGVIGFIGVMATPKSLPGLIYAFLFFITCGVYPSVITVVSWVSNNLSPTWKRAVGLAMCIMLANMGGIIGSNIFLAREAPYYWTGYGISLGILVNAILCTFILRLGYRRANQARDKLSEDEVLAKYTQQELLDLGDRSPLYRYVL